MSCPTKDGRRTLSVGGTHYLAYRHYYHRTSYLGFVLTVDQWKPVR